MKIVDVKTYPLMYWKDVPRIPRCFFLTKVMTDEGVFGFGEASSTYGHCYPLVVQEIVEGTFKRILVGEDPLRIEHLITKMRTYVWGYLGSSGVTCQAIAAVEIALWDILGKVANLPVYKLLGGDKEAIEVYACGTVKFDVDPTWHCEIFKEWLEKYGLKGVKIRVGKSKEWDEEFARVAREYIGPDKKLMIDAYMTYSPETAIEMAQRFAKYTPYFLEEPLPQDDTASLVRISRMSPVPIALGEHVTSLHGFKELVSLGIGNVFQPDVTISGGILEGMKICSMAEAFSVRCIPHIGGLTAVGIAANLHLALAHRNAKLLEIDVWEYQPLRDELLREPIFSMTDMSDGTMKAPGKPGLGIEINEEVLEKYPYKKGTPMYPEDFFPNYGAGRL